MPAVHIKNWYKKSGFQTGDEEKTSELNKNAAYVDSWSSIPKDAEFTDRAEAIVHVCADEQNTVRRLKKPRHKKWTIYTDDDEFDGDLHVQNISVVKRSGVKTKKQKVYHCPEPDDIAGKRWVGFGEEPEGLQHGYLIRSTVSKSRRHGRN